MRIVIIIVIAVVIYTIQNRLYKSRWNRQLDVSIEFEREYTECGTGMYLIESVTNDKFMPLPILHVKFATDRSFIFEDNENASVTDSYHRNDVFSIMGNEKIIRKLKFEVSKRGLYKIAAIELVAKNFFMTGSFARQMKNDALLYVFPQKYTDIRLDDIYRSFMGDFAARSSVIEDVFTFRGIRDYSSSDSMNRINWKASARSGALKTNIYDYSHEQRIKLILNLEPNIMLKSDAMSEICISLASSVASRLLNEHIPVALISNGIDTESGETCQVDIGGATEHMENIDKCLSRIGKNAGLEIFYDILKDELVNRMDNESYIIISSYCKEDLLLKLDYMNENNIPVKLIVPYYDIEKPEYDRDYIYRWEVIYDET